MEDMYVDFGLAQDTAAKIGNVEQFITNQMFHDALRVDSKEVVKKVIRTIEERERLNGSRVALLSVACPLLYLRMLLI